MKLGKESLLAIIESALFVLGALFFLLTLVSVSTPMWMLIVGSLCGLSGAILWLYPFVVRIITRAKSKHKNRQDQVAAISQQIQGADNPENDTYELHRADSYDNLADKALNTDQDDETETWQ